jgi:hypothetical protein
LEVLLKNCTGTPGQSIESETNFTNGIDVLIKPGTEDTTVHPVESVAVSETENTEALV